MAGITRAPITGDPLLFRDGQFASRNFGIDGASFATSILPKPKFLFFVEFIQPAESARLAGPGGQALNLSNPKEGIVFQIKQIDRPKFNIKTETLLQYNKKRVIQTGIEYQNMTISFHDDVSDRVMQFWARYYAFYYGDGRKTASRDWKDDIREGVFHEGPADDSIASGWGYIGKFGANANDMHFLESIKIYQFYAGRFTTMEFIHPKITIFDHDQNDYEDGREGSGIRMSFDYEGVIYNLNKESVNAPAESDLLENLFGVQSISENAARFGLDSTYFEIGSIISAEIPKTGGNKNLLPSSNDIADGKNITPTGINKLSNNLLAVSRRKVRAGTSVLSPTGITFGEGSGAGLSSSVVDFVTATSLVGQTPSADALQKATGVKNTIDNLGTSTSVPTQVILSNLPSAINTGTDVTKVTTAGSILSEIIVSTEQPIGPGQTAFADPSTVSKFKRSFGAASALAEDQGLVTATAAFPNAIDHTSADAPVMFNKLPDGSFQATERGLFVLQSLREPTSSLGTNRPKNPWVNPDAVDNNRRAFAAETDNPNLDVNNTISP